MLYFQQWSWIKANRMVLLALVLNAVHPGIFLEQYFRCLNQEYCLLWQNCQGIRIGVRGSVWKPRVFPVFPLQIQLAFHFSRNSFRSFASWTDVACRIADSNKETTTPFWNGKISLIKRLHFEGFQFHSRPSGSIHGVHALFTLIFCEPGSAFLSISSISNVRLSLEWLNLNV